MGVLSVGDTTVEAALTKLSYLLGQPDLSIQQVKDVSTSLYYCIVIDTLCVLEYEEGFARGNDS